MNKPSRNEIEKSLQASKHEASQKVERSLELPTNHGSSQRQSRVLGGNLGGVRRNIPKKNYGWWIAATCLILLSSLVFIIPEFMDDNAPKIAKEGQNTPPKNQIYQESRIDEASEQSINTSESAFTVPADRNRAADYRQKERQQQQINALITKATQAIASGNYTKPLNNNAFQYYQEILGIEPNNIAATDGIQYILTRLLTVGLSSINSGEIDAAKKSLSSIADVDAESEEYFDLSEAISNYEAAALKKIRDDKIKKLFALSEKAINKERLTSPKNDNASFYFQQILDLDPTNTAAREGIDQISQKYADLTEKNIQNREWGEAEKNIKTLKAANKDSALAGFLEKKLAEAKKQPEPSPASDNSNQIIASDGSGTLQQRVLAETNTVETQPRTLSQQTQSPFTGSSRQGAPAPTQDLSVASSQVPEREVFTTAAPVSDSLQTTNNAATNNTTTSNNNAPSTINDTRTTAVQNIAPPQTLQTGLQAYYSGEYVTAFSNLAPLANTNNTRAQIRVGYMYQFGRGVAQDQALGIDYLRKALPNLIRLAKQNQAWAQSDLGSLYEDGIVVTQSYSEALNWYRKAATQNYAGAQTNLGNMYFFGKGVSQSQDEAIKWYRLAAVGGDAIAKQNLIQLGAVNF
ncbi:MAG: tetratricopeptide repeat protein [Arenicella sp.]